LFTVITDVWRDSRFRGQYPVDSGKWEAIEIKATIAARHDPTIFTNIKITNNKINLNIIRIYKLLIKFHSAFGNY
jgi:hypothetical protein